MTGDAPWLWRGSPERLSDIEYWFGRVMNSQLLKKREKKENSPPFSCAHLNKTKLKERKKQNTTKL